MDQSLLDWNPLKGDPEFEKLAAQGWEYRNTPRMHPESWSLIMGVIGDENMKPLTFVETTDPNGQVWHRGQFLISARGRENLAAYGNKQ